jgi:endonuclease YncB( thermonuclease family)
VVASIIDGDTLTLNDGRHVRLVGIQAPKLPLGRPGFKAWPLAEEAKRALEQLALGRQVRFVLTPDPKDRYGRVLAHLYRQDGLWIQGEMLKKGMARVYTFPDNALLARQMLAHESEARAGKKGIWAHPFFRVRQVTETPQLIDSFQIVEGRVRAVFEAKRGTYVDFGEDYREDFSLFIPKARRRSFARAGIALEALANRELRVRGWLKRGNGPLIEVTHPEQIEVLS